MKKVNIINDTANVFIKHVTETTLTFVVNVQEHEMLDETNIKFLINESHDYNGFIEYIMNVKAFDDFEETIQTYTDEEFADYYLSDSREDDVAFVVITVPKEDIKEEFIYDYFLRLIDSNDGPEINVYLK